MWETWVLSLDCEIPWRRAWKPTPVFLPGESPQTEEPGGLQSMGSQRIRHNWATKHRGTKILQAMWWGQKNEGKKNDSMISCYNTHVLYSLSCVWQTVCNLMDSSPAGSSVHGVFQQRILGWVAILSFRGSSQSRYQTHISCLSCIAGGIFTAKLLGKSYNTPKCL